MCIYNFDDFFRNLRARVYMFLKKVGFLVLFITKFIHSHSQLNFMFFQNLKNVHFLQNYTILQNKKKYIEKYLFLQRNFFTDTF